jgi:hypothetical protein
LQDDTATAAPRATDLTAATAAPQHRLAALQAAAQGLRYYAKPAKNSA